MLTAAVALVTFLCCAEYMKDPQYMSMLKMLQANPNNLSMLQNDKRIMEVLACLIACLIAWIYPIPLCLIQQQLSVSHARAVVTTVLLLFVWQTIAFLFGMELPAGGAGGGAGAAPAPAPAPAAAAKEPEAPAKDETAEEKAQRETR